MDEGEETDRRSKKVAAADTRAFCTAPLGRGLLASWRALLWLLLSTGPITTTLVILGHNSGKGMLP